MSLMTSSWPKLVLRNFNQAAKTYNTQAKLQRAIAWRLAKQCSVHPIPDGLWVDLGAGTGLLADALEEINPAQKILRLDGSSEMLERYSSIRPSQLWDLNKGLPCWQNKPNLIASSFALHWLINPVARLEEWFLALPPGGWLALTLPIAGSFPQWHQAAKDAKVRCTAIQLPSQREISTVLPTESIRFQKLFRFTQRSPNSLSLIRAMRKTGAHASSTKSLTIKDWRRLEKSWPLAKDNELSQLTWLIQFLVVQK